MSIRLQGDQPAGQARNLNNKHHKHDFSHACEMTKQT